MTNIIIPQLLKDIVIDSELPQYNYNIFEFDYGETDTIFKKSIEKMFIDCYFYNNIGFDNIEEFKHRLEYKWCIGYAIFKKKYNAYSQDIEILRTGKATATTETSYTDTPTGIFLTDTEHPTNTAKNTANTETIDGQEIDLIYNYTQKLKNTEREFIESFKGLFLKVYE